MLYLVQVLTYTRERAKIFRDMKYIDGSLIDVGDVFTDGSTGREDVRLRNRAKVLYVDRYTLVWFPLNEFTRHGSSTITSNTHCLSFDPKKVELGDLSEEELRMYLSSDIYLQS